MKKRSWLIILFIVAIVFYLIYFFMNYKIDDSKNAIEKVIAERIEADIEVRATTITDNIMHAVFTIDERIGTAALKRGWNNKYKIGTIGHGTNTIRERVIVTNSGQYLRLAGRNDQDIGTIEAYIEEEKYHIKIPDDDYYIVLTPIKETEYIFTTAKIVYDRDGKELYRVNLPVE